MKKRLFLILILVLLALASCSSGKYDFKLKSAFSEETSLKDFKNDKLIIYFGYTFCPDVCPASLSLVGKILKQISSKEARLLFISLDLARDSDINATNEWLRYFYQRADALIAASESDLEKVTKAYGVKIKKVVMKDSLMQYSIAHSNELFLIDKGGKFVKSINDFSPEELSKELRNFLNFN